MFQTLKLKNQNKNFELIKSFQINISRLPLAHDKTNNQPPVQLFQISFLKAKIISPPSLILLDYNSTFDVVCNPEMKSRKSYELSQRPRAKL